MVSEVVQKISSFMQDKKMKIKKIKIRRWNVEMILLGFMLVPIMLFTMWMLQINSRPDADVELVRKTLTGISVGVIGLLIWMLGASVIIINILIDILSALEEKNARSKHE